MDKTHPDYGRGIATLDLEQLGLMEPDALVGRLLGVFNAPGYKPPVLPAVAVQLLELSRKPDVSLKSIVRLLQTEPMLSAQVLKIAQSPLFGGQNVKTMNDAIIRLGLRRLTDLFIEASMGKVFRARGYEALMEKLRLHSSATAHLTKLMCAKARIKYENAFLSRLMHDIGLVALLIVIADRPKKSAPVPPIDDPCLSHALNEAHAKAGGELTALWGIPKDVQEIVVRHHDFTPGGENHPVVAALCLAESIASSMGFAVVDFESRVDLKEAADAVKLSADQLIEVRADAEKLLAALR